MPPTRTLQVSARRSSKNSKALRDKANEVGCLNSTIVAKDEDTTDLAKCDVYYPKGEAARQAFRTKNGKIVTAHQWAVYDIVKNVPVGKVTTYKDICLLLGQGSSRSVGAALRNNPFAPLVPCHRVIASSRYIGGFLGEWGPDTGTGKQCNRKLATLAQEGVGFDKEGYLLEGASRIWRGVTFSLKSVSSP